MAAYIDLNAYRVGMAEQVEDYRWCDYASAVAGNRWARMGLGRILRPAGPEARPARVRVEGRVEAEPAVRRRRERFSPRERSRVR